MKQASLADITYEHALGLVQLRKEAIDTGDVTPLSPGTLATSFPMRDAGNRLLRSSSEKRAAGFMDNSFHCVLIMKNHRPGVVKQHEKTKSNIHDHENISP